MDINKKQKYDNLLGSVLLAVIRIPVVLLGNLLKRDHSLAPKGDMLVIKMQGGGSLIIAYPALLGIRNKYKDRKMLLFTTSGLKQFGESMNIFDEIICINDKSLFSMLLSTLTAWKRIFRKIDTVIDLEVYSKLTTVFSALTAARNRLGFYLESTYWRKRIHTHLIFFNRYSGVFYFYEEFARILNAPIASRKMCEEHFRKNLLPVSRSERSKRISIGHACSELGPERMLKPHQWVEVFMNRDVGSEEFVFLGSKADFSGAEQIIDALKEHFPDALFVNKCGELSLMESVSYIDSSDEFWGIDSALIHYARLLGKKNVSFWGPTDPNTLLKNDPEVPSEVYYKKVPCSPCIHVANAPPCEGRNICIDALFGKKSAAWFSDSSIKTISKINYKGD